MPGLLTPRRALHEEIHAAIDGLNESETRVQAARRVELLDVNADRPSGPVRLVEYFTDEARADAGVSRLRHQRNVDDADLLRAARNVEPPYRLAVLHDQVEGGAVVVVLPIPMLKFELLRHEI